ncbi:MAG TPA: flagellar protein FlbD [Actinobacteria bacterium]|nr:flagellar protein FlbD [Actinomycetota bacterium]
MIELTRLNGSKLTINAALIETIEATPDTVITLLTGKKIVIKESPDVIVKQTVKYLSKIGGPKVIIPKNELKNNEV